VTVETLKTVYVLPNFLQWNYPLEAGRKVGDAKLWKAKQGNPLVFRHPQKKNRTEMSGWVYTA